MLLNKTAFLFLIGGGASLASAAAGTPVKAPQRITYTDLATTSDADADADADGSNHLFLDALTQDGYISITDIITSSSHRNADNDDNGGNSDGLSFRELKQTLMSHLHECLMDIEGDNVNVVPTQHLEDGTVRRSFATVTPPSSAHHHGTGEPIHLLEEFLARHPQSKSTPATAACGLFQQHLSNFRSTVGHVTRLFATRLSTELNVSLPKPLLMSSGSSSNNDDGDYDDVASAVMGGEQLEHFHSYHQHQGGNTASGDVDSSSTSTSTSTTSTIELHTDQGLFIAFTPGLLVKNDQQAMDLSDGFYVQDIHGANALLDFTQEDDLVFMLGDAVNRIINDQLVGGDNKKKVLRATPHALSLKSKSNTEHNQPRVWYGRMALPPNDAYLPTTATTAAATPTTTFGQLRQVHVESTSKGTSIPMGSIGCSSANSKMVINTSRRALAGEEGEHNEGEEEGEDEGHGVSANQCAEDELFCWFRCMAIAEEHKNCDAEPERNLALQCVNPRGQVLKDGLGHGDYFPACSNETHTTNPPLPYPLIDQQDPDECTADEWDEFNSQDDYTHVVSLKPDPTEKGPETNLLWSITDNADGTKKLKARLTYNGVFGWLAMGFANKLDTIHNGMNGGKILLMVPGGNYSAVTGLDLSVGSNIGAYVIDDKDSAFRHWVDTGSAADGASHEHTDCFTALTFESDHISGQKFNLEEGSDEIIWAGNSNDYFVGYHSRESRARLTVNWLTGDVDFFISKPPAWQTTAGDTDTDTLGDDTAAGDGSSSDDTGTDVVANDQLGDATIADDSSSSYAVVSASVGLTVMIISVMMF